MPDIKIPGPWQWLLVFTLALAFPSRARAEDANGPVTVKGLDGKLVCVGDSITEGYLASNRSELGYVGQLRRLAAESHRTLEVINEGRSGWSTGAFAYNAAKLAESLPADATLITILLGTNDAHEQGTPVKIAADAVRNLDKIIQSYRAKAPRAEFVIITPPESYPSKFTGELLRAHYDEQTPAKLTAIVEAYQAFCKRSGLRLIDVSKLPGIEHAPDGVHLDDAGHAMLARVIWRELNSGKTPEASPGAEPPPTKSAGGPH